MRSHALTEARALPRASDDCELGELCLLCLFCAEVSSDPTG